jgi:hypothetical protein
VTRQAHAAWWVIPVVVGLLLLFVGVLIGFNTPEATELPPGAKALYACGSPFHPGAQRDVPVCKASLDGRRWKAETALAIGGVLLVIGGAIAFLQRRPRPTNGRRERAAEPELRAAS